MKSSSSANGSPSCPSSLTPTSQPKQKVLSKLISAFFRQSPTTEAPTPFPLISSKHHSQLSRRTDAVEVDFAPTILSNYSREGGSTFTSFSSTSTSASMSSTEGKTVGGSPRKEYGVEEDLEVFVDENDEEKGTLSERIVESRMKGWDRKRVLDEDKRIDQGLRSMGL